MCRLEPWGPPNTDQHFTLRAPSSSPGAGLSLHPRVLKPSIIVLLADWQEPVLVGVGAGITGREIGLVRIPGLWRVLTHAPMFGRASRPTSASLLIWTALGCFSKNSLTLETLRQRRYKTTNRYRLFPYLFIRRHDSRQMRISGEPMPSCQENP